MDFDLPDFDARKGANQGYELQLLDPKTNAPTERYITVHGVDSDAYQAAALDQRRRWLKTKVNKRAAGLTPEELENEALWMLAAATSGWRGIRNSKGEEVPFSREAAVQLYRQFAAIREQVDEAIGDRQLFLPGSSTS